MVSVAVSRPARRAEREMTGKLVVQQFPAGVAEGARPEIAQLPHRRGVESRRRNTLGAPCSADAERSQPAAHLAGGAGRERHREHLPRVHLSGVDEVRDPACDGARLAGPGTGQHTHRPPWSEDRRTLFGVETPDDRVGDDRVCGIGFGERIGHAIHYVICHRRRLSGGSQAPSIGAGRR